MPRPPRKQYAGALYHVTSRGNGRNQIFMDDADAERFLRQLQDNLETYEVVLYAYVLMPNHYHLVVRTRHANLSRFMQRLNTSYALYSRYKHRKPGHRLEGRYKAKVVQGDDYILTLTRYLHLNPVKVKALKGQTPGERRDYLEGYKWSSYRGYVEERAQEELVCYDVLKRLDTSMRKARKQYREYVRAYLTKDDLEAKDLMERSGHGVGDEDYVEELEADLRGQKSGEGRDGNVAYPERRMGCESIDAVVVRAYRVGAKDLWDPGRCRAVVLAKTAAIEIACRMSGMTQRAIGARYGGISSQAVSAVRKRAKRMIPIEFLSRLMDQVRNKTKMA